MKTLLALLLISSFAFAQAPHGTDPQPVVPVKPVVKPVKKSKKNVVKPAAPVVTPVVAAVKPVEVKK